MLVAIYNRGEEVIVLPVDSSGEHIGKSDFFDDNDPQKRDEEDFNVTIGTLPLQIEYSSVSVLTLEKEF